MNTAFVVEGSWSDFPDSENWSVAVFSTQAAAQAYATCIEALMRSLRDDLTPLPVPSGMTHWDLTDKRFMSWVRRNHKAKDAVQQLDPHFYHPASTYRVIELPYNPKPKETRP